MLERCDIFRLFVASQVLHSAWIQGYSIFLFFLLRGLLVFIPQLLYASASAITRASTQRLVLVSSLTLFPSVALVKTDVYLVSNLSKGHP